MKTKATIQTQMFMRRLFMMMVLLSIIFWPTTLFLACAAIISTSGILGGLCAVSGVVAIAATVTASTWYYDNGVPMKLKFSKRDEKKVQANEDFIAFREFQEQQEVRRLIAAEADKIAFKGDLYRREGRWVKAGERFEYYYRNEYGEELKLPKELT